MAAPLEPWSIAAVNLAEHADNPVHTEAGGRAAGYDGAVVAGTTIYAYLTRPAAAAWARRGSRRGARPCGSVAPFSRTSTSTSYRSPVTTA
ncbi:MAG: hypothetical protein R8F63_15615 [Acidimicrobiales bacterium]|nr:hypothetical protein [Acidimicrobiales bacterium]